MPVAFLALLLLAGSVQSTTPDSTVAQRIQATGPFDDIIDLDQSVFTSVEGLLALGNYHSAPDLQDGGYLYAIGEDSTVWIQNPDKASLTTSGYALIGIGQDVEQRLVYDRAIEPGIGYGWEDGKVFLYSRFGVPVLTAVLLGIGGLGLVMLWLALQLRRSRRRSRELEDSRRRLAESRESERLRLSRELHDGPLQDLQVVRMQMGVASHRATTSGGDGDPSVAEDAVLRVIGELREIAEGLRPPVLSTFGLGAALRSLIDRHHGTSPDIRIDLDLADEGDQLDDDVRLALYRIGQEAIGNAIRHGAPGTIRVSYDASPTQLRLSVEDDGIGMEVPTNLYAFEPDGHLGLAGMAERAESVGGRLHVQSEMGATRVAVTVPLASRARRPRLLSFVRS